MTTRKKINLILFFGILIFISFYGYNISENKGSIEIKNEELTVGQKTSNLEKGIIIQYTNDENKNIYLYPSYDDFINYDSLELWANTTYNNYSNIYPNTQIKYWRITQYSCITINRDTNWFNNVLPLFQDFWNKILIYKKNNQLFLQDIINTSKKKISNNNNSPQQQLIISGLKMQQQFLH